MADKVTFEVKSGLLPYSPEHRDDDPDQDPQGGSDSVLIAQEDVDLFLVEASSFSGYPRLFEKAQASIQRLVSRFTVPAPVALGFSVLVIAVSALAQKRKYDRDELDRLESVHTFQDGEQPEVLDEQQEQQGTHAAPRVAKGIEVDQ